MAEKNYYRLFEEILTLLCWNEKTAPLLAHSVKIEYFGDSVDRDIAKIAIDFYLKYKKVVGPTLIGEIEVITKGKEPKVVARYIETAEKLYANRLYDNTAYTIGRLDEFIAKQEFELTIRKSISLADDEDYNVEDMYEVFRKATKQRSGLFDLGIRINNVEAVIESSKNGELYVTTGIPELDELGICPTPGELMVITAPVGRGKTWFAIHLLRHAFTDFNKNSNDGTFKCCHIALEMGQGATIQRYWQNFFSIMKNPGERQVKLFGEHRYDRQDKFATEIRTVAVDETVVVKKLSFNDDDIESKLRKLASGDKNKSSLLKHDNLIIKEFNPGQLTMSGLYAYLDGLETFEDFKPDILVLDYPDLMDIPVANYRLSLGGIYKELKGLAKERNMALIVPCQVNRAGDDKSTVITRTNMGEDISKAATCDVHITYNQTPKEREQGIARLYIDKNRRGVSGSTIIITQDYGIGKFCIDSRFSGKNYDPATGTINPNAPAE